LFNRGGTGSGGPANLSFDIRQELVNAIGGGGCLFRLGFCQYLRGFAVHEPRLEGTIDQQYKYDQPNERDDELAEDASSAKQALTWGTVQLR